MLHNLSTREKRVTHKNAKLVYHCTLQLPPLLSNPDKPHTHTELTYLTYVVMLHHVVEKSIRKERERIMLNWKLSKRAFCELLMVMTLENNNYSKTDQKKMIIARGLVCYRLGNLLRKTTHFTCFTCTLSLSPTLTCNQTILKRRTLWVQCVVV